MGEPLAKKSTRGVKIPGHKVCVILGAGASHGVRNVGTPDRHPELRPPLANKLFDMNENSHYFQTIMEPYPRAKVLTQIIAPTAAAGTTTIETELARLARHDDLQTSQDFKQIPPYLRDLLHKVSKDYIPLPGHYIQLAHLLLKDHQCEVLFLVLNYDDLLEQALTHLYPSLKFSNIRHYVDTERPFKVVKLHGSINWFTKLSDLHTDNWADLVSNLDIFAKIPEEDIFINESVVKTSDWIGDDVNRYVYPLVTAPVASEDKAPVCPDSHYDFAKQFLSDCETFLVIGTAALDQDVFDLINSSAPSTTNAVLHVVDHGNIESTTKNLRDGVGIFMHSNLTRSNAGFGGYLGSTEVQNLVKHING